jgi:hypothetical protein
LGGGALTSHHPGRWTEYRACWLDMQSMIARIFGQIADLPSAATDDEVRVH